MKYRELKVGETILHGDRYLINVLQRGRAKRVGKKVRQRDTGRAGWESSTFGGFVG